MSDLVAITYPDQHRAAEVFAILQRMEAERLADLADAVFVTKDYKGDVKLHQAVNLTSTHAALGAVWEALIGSLFTASKAGLTPSAAHGTHGRSSAGHGFDGQFSKELSTTMPPGSSALFVLVRQATAKEVGDEIRKYGGTVLYTPLPSEMEFAFSNGSSGETATIVIIHPPACRKTRISHRR